MPSEKQNDILQYQHTGLNLFFNNAMANKKIPITELN